MPLREDRRRFGQRLGFAAIVLSGFGLFLRSTSCRSSASRSSSRSTRTTSATCSRSSPTRCDGDGGRRADLGAALPGQRPVGREQGPAGPFMSMAVRTRPSPACAISTTSATAVDAGTAAVRADDRRLPVLRGQHPLIAAKTSPIGPGGGQGFQGGATNLAGILGGFTADGRRPGRYDTLRGWRWGWVPQRSPSGSSSRSSRRRVRGHPEDAVSVAAVAAMAPPPDGAASHSNSPTGRSTT